MKNIIATVLSLSLLAASTATSFANPNRHNDNRNHHRVEKIEKKKSDKDAIAAGIIGLTAGAIIGGVIGKNNAKAKPTVTPIYPPPHHQPSRYDKKPRHYDHRYNSKQWGSPYSPEWYRYCSSKYRSFNPKNGTYRTHNGKVQFCEIPERERRGRR